MKAESRGGWHLLSSPGPQLSGPLQSEDARIAKGGRRERVAPHDDGGGVGTEPQVMKAMVGGRDVGVAVSMMVMTRSASKLESAKRADGREDRSPRNRGECVVAR